MKVGSYQIAGNGEKLGDSEKTGNEEEADSCVEVSLDFCEGG